LRLDPRSHVGLAAQIRARIALLIADGALESDDRLPPVRGLARQLGVNVNTVRSAYAQLEADGLVRTRHGVGTVVLAARPEDLRSSRSLGVNTVAVLVAGLNPFYLALMRGIEEVAADRGMLVVVADTHDSPSLAEATIRRFIARGIDGLIAVSVGGIANGGRRSGRSDGRLPPIVYVDQPDRSGYVLLFDGHQGGYLATRHLQEHGHARIGIVTAPRSWPNVRDVYDGYVEAMTDAGGPVSSALVSEVDGFSLEAGRIGLARLLDLPEPPSAVFAAGETFALGVVQEAKLRGIPVPEDLATVGYTDSPTAELVEPPLTMVSVPAREIGVRAMETLSELISGRKPRPRRTVLGVDLVVRGSCGLH
jgi:DNA-binding LacI/PurR family transcriptional regulator